MTAPARKRPWYLVLALLGALALGSMGACRGWKAVELYREPVDMSLAGEGIADEADRAAVVARAQAFLQTLDAEKARGWPLAVATLILGGALFTFAIRAMGGSAGSRAVLIQLVMAQAATNALSLLLLHDVFDAEFRYWEAWQAARIRANPPDGARTEETLRTLSSVAPAVPGVELALYSITSALIVVALTRRRSRDLLDAGTEVLGDS
ncbi:MAG TPA: hypothetical protein VEK07_24820 [Polyangiaceae bacterium]|nr:hypothetical protein [Polyangiaceae bacterium]